MTYTEEFREVIVNKFSNRTLYKNNKGGPSKYFLEFLSLCEEFNVDISVFPDSLPFMEIIHCITENRGPKVCTCGKLITRSFQNRQWCSVRCRSRDSLYCKSISDKKSELYKDKEWKNIVEVKKIATCLKNNGVEYPMQNVKIFEKQQAACFEKDENGLHGYEPHVYGFLKQLYPKIQLGTKYLKDTGLSIRWCGENGKFHQSYPDFFCEEINSFIEVKSDYTRKLHHEKLMRCKDELNNMGFGYYICVVFPKKNFVFTEYNHSFIIDKE